MLLQTITAALQTAFEAHGIDSPVVLSPSNFYDFQCNAALSGAKRIGKNPMDLAASVAAQAATALPGVKVHADKGFINIEITADRLSEALNNQIIQAKPSDGEIIYLDFGGPNVAKPMHVGHLRSLVIGDSLQRILRFSGYNVVSDIHLGDFGLQMGLLLAQLSEMDTELVTLDMLEEAYPMASKRAKTDDGFREKAQKLTAIIQSGFDNHIEVEKWRKFIKVSMESVNRDIDALGILFTLFKGESDSQPRIPQTIGMLASHGFLEEHDGAQITRACEPPMVLITQAGTALYSLTDLATMLQRRWATSLPASKIIYVVDQRQALHFKQLFEVADKIDLFPKDRLVHVGFGTVNGTDGRPLKTRDGGSPKLYDLIEAAKAKACELNPEVGDIVAIGALKFADLQNLRSSSYQFDLDRFLSFEGKTGPYLMYQAVRIKRLLASSTVKPGEVVVGDTPEERALALVLATGFDLSIKKALADYSPKEMADFAYDLAQAFSRFYTVAPISGNASRLGLAAQTLHQLETALDLLGIEVPASM